jgi:hypothetical protein
LPGSTAATYGRQHVARSFTMFSATPDGLGCVPAAGGGQPGEVLRTWANPDRIARRIQIEERRPQARSESNAFGSR